jgi:3D (Asp-Asp-Asp) domain-containing protein
MKKFKKYKLANPKRFIGFCLTIVWITGFIVACYHVNKITTTTIDRNREIQEELKDAIIIPEELEEISFKSTTEEPELTSLGSFTVTAYCCCKDCCGKNPTHPAYGITKTGTKATEGRTIAVDPSVIPLGSTVYLNDIPYTAEDTGSAIKGNKIDLFINDHQRAKEFGIQKMEVKL